MTKQELEQAIENGESVWYVYEDDLRKIELTKYIQFNQFGFTNSNDTWRELYSYDKTFATKQQAEHYLHHANITRTETLPFLTWEEFLEEKEIKFNSKKSEYLMIYLAGNITIYQCYYDDNGLKLQLRIFDEEATEENFYKAYDECVRLFKGG